MNELPPIGVVVKAQCQRSNGIFEYSTIYEELKQKIQQRVGSGPMPK